LAITPFLVVGASGRDQDGHPPGRAAAGGTLFLVRNDGLRGFDLWKSDTFSDEIVLVGEIAPGPRGSKPLDRTGP